MDMLEDIWVLVEVINEDTVASWVWLCRLDNVF